MSRCELMLASVVPRNKDWTENWTGPILRK